jgi:hypothetical protein
MDVCLSKTEWTSLVPSRRIAARRLCNSAGAVILTRAAP